MGLFDDSRVPTAKFNQIGDSVSGVIVGDVEEVQRTEFIQGQKSGGALMYWHNSKPTAGMAVDPGTGEPNRPVMDKVVTVDTDEVDEYGESERRIFIKGKQTISAIKEALKAAGVRDIAVGGRLTCTWASGAGGTQDPRVYAFEYVPPAEGELVSATAGAPSGATTSAGKKSRDEEIPF